MIAKIKLLLDQFVEWIFWAAADFLQWLDNIDWLTL